jgi:hypothetical protein
MFESPDLVIIPSRPTRLGILAAGGLVWAIVVATMYLCAGGTRGEAAPKQSLVELL